MKGFVPVKKQTKRRQKAFHALKRASWGSVVPVSRVIPSGKAYDRRAGKRAEREAKATSDG